MRKKRASNEVIVEQIVIFTEFMNRMEDRINRILIDDRARLRNVYSEIKGMDEAQVKQFFSIWKTEIIEKVGKQKEV